MKSLAMIGILVLAVVVSACDNEKQANQKTSGSDSQIMGLKVINWGPQNAENKTNPNMQPDGSMGVWIEVSGTQTIGEAQVLFDGKPAKSTSIQAKLITAAISPAQLVEPGEREVAIKQMATNKITPVGVFTVTKK